MKLFLIAGKSGHGKDSLGYSIKKEYESMGQQVCILHIAKPLYNYAMDHFGWDGTKENRPREFFQKMGVEIIKEKLNKPYFLIDRLTEDIDILSHFFDVGIITDGRLISEFEELKVRFPELKIIHIYRADYDNNLKENEQTHVTELELEQYSNYDYTIINNSLDELDRCALNIVKNERRAGGVKHE